MNKKSRSVLITGAGSGIGKATAAYLSSKDFFVYATDFNVELLEEFHSFSNIYPLKMDVTSDKDIKSVFTAVKNEQRGLFALVNNAGISKVGPVLEAPEEELKLQFNVNTFGMFRVTKTFFPLIKESGGRIVNISSSATRFVSPFYGFYSMSKLAVEAFSDALRRELAPLGIKVAIIQPGPTRTDIWDKTYPDPGLYSDSIFKERMEKFVKLSIDDWKPKSLPPEKLAKVIHHAITSKRPKIRYLVTKSKLQQLFISKIPSRWADYLLFRLYD